MHDIFIILFLNKFFILQLDRLADSSASLGGPVYPGQSIRTVTYGIRGNALGWFRNYLTCSRQMVNSQICHLLHVEYPKDQFLVLYCF